MHNTAPALHGVVPRRSLVPDKLPPRASLARYRRARDLFEEVGNLPGLAMTLGNIGSIEIDRGAYDAADVALDRADRSPACGWPIC